MSELLPCPFCGTTGNMIYRHDRPVLHANGKRDAVFVEIRHWCSDGSQPMVARKGTNLEEAQAAWNQRAKSTIYDELWT